MSSAPTMQQEGHREEEDVEAGLVPLEIDGRNGNHGDRSCSNKNGPVNSEKCTNNNADCTTGTATHVEVKAQCEQQPIRKRTSTGTFSTSTTVTSSDDSNISSMVPPDPLEDLAEYQDDNNNDDDVSDVRADKKEKAKQNSEIDDNVDLALPDSCAWRWFKRIVGGSILLCLLLLFSVLIGARIEKWTWPHADVTTHYYQGAEMCAMPVSALLDDNTNATAAQTFASVQAAHDADEVIAHCGACGQCSTAHDLHILARTRETLTLISTRCAFSIFLGMRTVDQCMQTNVGFTPACNQCWLDNIQCSFHHCKFTCIKYKLFRQGNNDGDEKLNDCLECDERMCGPGFVQCSGSNRRRMGIVSDIERDQNIEQCSHVDIDWLGNS